MGATEDHREFSTAWTYYKRTGVILPGYQGEISERLAEHNGRGEGTERGDEGATSERVQA